MFAHLTHLLAGVAPYGLGLLLEGGYNLAATSQAVEGCLRVLLGETPPPLPGPWGTTSQGWVGIMNTLQVRMASGGRRRGEEGRAVSCLG